MSLFTHLVHKRQEMIRAPICRKWFGGEEDEHKLQLTGLDELDTYRLFLTSFFFFSCQINYLPLWRFSNSCHLSAIQSSILPSLCLFYPLLFLFHWDCEWRWKLSLNSQVIDKMKWMFVMLSLNKLHLTHLIDGAVVFFVFLLDC